jgi:hypothetical protein
MEKNQMKKIVGGFVKVKFLGIVLWSKKEAKGSDWNLPWLEEE